MRISGEQVLAVFAWLGLATIAIGGPLWFGRLTIKNIQLTAADQRLKQWARLLPVPSADEWQATNKQLHERARLYNSHIERTHLLAGMVVHRRLDNNQALGICDSLLFSGLRYTALKKMGLDVEAQQAWHALSQSQRRGEWLRHPQCELWASRDMIVGLLIALSQHPLDGTQHIGALLEYIKRSYGSFGAGPFYLSTLSPSLADLIRQLAQTYGFTETELPIILSFGFSTFEWDSLALSRGYTSHLVGLRAWLAMELAEELAGGPQTEEMQATRLRWLTMRLAATDANNLFFRWLRLKAAGLLNLATRHALMKELLVLTQFPSTHLPRDCQRQADYMWQRDSREYAAASECTVEYSGVDFLWLAGLLAADHGKDLSEPAKIQ